MVLQLLTEPCALQQNHEIFGETQGVFVVISTN